MFRASSILSAFLLFSAASAHAQETPKPSWRKDFDKVEVKRIDPEDLPGPEESKFPTSLQSNNVLLPAPPKLETLRKTAAAISDRVVEVVAVTRPDLGLVSPQVYVRGHAVWLSAAPGGADPVLVTNLHWLKDAEKVVVLPADKRQSGDAPQVSVRSISKQHGDLARLIKERRGVAVTPVSADKHRNLVVLSAPIDDLAPQLAHGLQDLRHAAPVRRVVVAQPAPVRVPGQGCSHPASEMTGRVRHAQRISPSHWVPPYRTAPCYGNQWRFLYLLPDNLIPPVY